MNVNYSVRRSAATAAALLTFAIGGAAQALPVNFANPGEFASVGMLGFVTTTTLNANLPGDLVTTPSVTFSAEINGLSSLQGEFAGLTGPSVGLNNLELFIEAGALNNGKSFTLGYNRSTVTNPTNGEFGSEVGSVTFTISNTLAAEVVIPTTGTFNDYSMVLVGSATTSDGGAVYNQNQLFSILINGVYEKGATAVQPFFMTVLSPPDLGDIVELSEPLSLALLGLGVVAIGLVGRYRR